VTKTSYQVKSTVSLAGVTAKQFDDKAKNGFKSAVAKLAGKHCGSATALTQCTLNNVDILSFADVTSRRATSLSVAYVLYAASQAAAANATSTLGSVSNADFTAAVNAGFKAYGSTASTTGVTVTSQPVASTSSSSSSGLGAGAIAGIVIACVVCVVIVGVVVFFSMKKKDGHQDGTAMHGTAIRGADHKANSPGGYNPPPPTMGNDSATAGQI
jgi:hypothetical protein